MRPRTTFGPLLWVSPLVVAGCGTVAPDRSFTRVQAAVAERNGAAISWPTTPEAAAAIEALVRGLLVEPIDADRAVAIALLNNRTLRAEYSRLGLAEADLVEAGMLENPRLSAGVGFPDGPPSGTGIDLGVTLNLLRLLIAPARKEITGVRLDAEVLALADRVVGTAAETRKAFLDLQAAEHATALLKEMTTATEAAADFARLLYDAGNISDLALANEQSLYEQTRLEYARSRAEAADLRERLNVQLGLWGSQTEWQAVARLPDLPADEPDMTELESLAVRQRLDLAAAAKEVEALAMAAGLQRDWRLLLTTEIGGSAARDTDGQWVFGPQLSLDLPIFDQRQAEITRLDAALLGAEARLEGLAIETRSEVRRLRDRLYASRYEAEHLRDTVLPLRERITALTQEEYNFMLVDAFELLAAKREEIAADRAYLQSLHDYWVVRAELERAVGGRLPDSPTSTPPTPPMPETPDPHIPAATPDNHGGHDHAH